ncbi:MAG: hypothetical protein EXQ79_00415 [Acidimicrobiia bacterium]|nr:hypothetical protein [Acidimicrobiia bacterium]
MSAEAVVPAPAACPLCESAVGGELAQCPACGFDLAGVGGRPSFTQPVFWWSAMGFLAVYLVTLAIVAMTR